MNAKGSLSCLDLRQYRSDEDLIAKRGKRKAFFTGGNSMCRQHIRCHYEVYHEHCEAQKIKENHHAIPHNVLAERRAVKKKVPGQMTLDSQFSKVTGASAWTFSREDVLKSVTEFVVCDNQVSRFAKLCER